MLVGHQGEVDPIKRKMDFVKGAIRKRFKHPLWFVNAIALLFFALVFVSYYFLGMGFAAPTTFRPGIGTNSVEVGSGNNKELARILERASTPNKTVILTSLSKAWAVPNSVLDLMLESFRRGNNTERLVKHLVVVSFDNKAHSRCVSLDLHCYLLEVQGFNFSKETGFMTHNYLEIVWRKVEFLHLVLSLGYNFFFSDNDVLWFRDPFPHLQEGDVDFQVSCDNYNGKPYNMWNGPNTGIMYAKSNKRTILFFEFWYYSRSLFKGEHDQAVFDIIKASSLFKMIGLKVKFLDTTLFGGFCQPSTDFNKVCTMHANCCTRLSHKVHDLKLILDDWRNYSSSSPPQSPPHPFKWSAPQYCSPPKSLAELAVSKSRLN